MIATRLLPLMLLLAVAAAARPPGLTIKPGETWTFVIEKGQPSRARRVQPMAKPGKGEVQAAVRSVMGTGMSISGQVPVSYNFRVELTAAGKTIAKRACTLPANNRPAFEFWQEKAETVRIYDFHPAGKGGSCP